MGTVATAIAITPANVIIITWCVMTCNRDESLQLLMQQDDQRLQTGANDVIQSGLGKKHDGESHKYLRLIVCENRKLCHKIRILFGYFGGIFR